MSYQLVSDRIIWTKLKGSSTPLHIVQIYAPTSETEDDIMDGFYDELSRIVAMIPNREILIIMGDWNAKIGVTSIRNTVGNNGIRNERGVRMLQFCSVDNQLKVANTLFT